MFLINKGLKVAFATDRTSVLVGRAPECDLRLDHPTVSKNHVRLTLENGVWSVEDLGSVNLTYINGTRITGHNPLQPGDYLRLDIYTLVFFADEPPQVPEISVTDATGAVEHRLPFTQPRLAIGRNLVGNHIAVTDPRVSGLHLVLERRDRRWIATPVKREAGIRVNQARVDPPVSINPGDKLQIGTTTFEIVTPIVAEWGTVTQAMSRLQDAYKAVRMQARTVEDAMHENFPAIKGEHDWLKMLLEVFEHIEQNRGALQATADTLRQLMPSMETQEEDNRLLHQAVRDARRCINLANYLDLTLRHGRLSQIQNADLSLQRELIGKLLKDVRGCIETDNPTLFLD